MAGLPDEMRITMLLPNPSKSDHDLCPAHLLPLSPKNLTFDETIENSYGHKEGFYRSSQRLPYTGFRRGLYQAQHRQAHDILTTMQVNVNRRRYETLCINGTFLQLEVDTGPDITIVVSNKVWRTLGSPGLDIVPSKVSTALGDAVQLSEAMKCEATFKAETATILCYAADRDINLLGLDWIDTFNILEPKIQSVTCPQV
ncbi:unnamed protein product [Hymenolepis diminuta]|nr:unnamed protein product [Hymenolepis diminuta]